MVKVIRMYFAGLVNDAEGNEQKVYYGFDGYKDGLRIHFGKDRIGTPFSKDSDLTERLIDRIRWNDNLSALWRDYVTDDGKWKADKKQAGVRARKEALKTEWLKRESKSNNALGTMAEEKGGKRGDETRRAATGGGAEGRTLSAKNGEALSAKKGEALSAKKGGALSAKMGKALSGRKGEVPDAGKSGGGERKKVLDATKEALSATKSKHGKNAHGKPFGFSTNDEYPGQLFGDTDIPINDSSIEKLAPSKRGNEELRKRFGYNVNNTLSLFFAGVLDNDSVEMVNWVEACFYAKAIRVDRRAVLEVLKSRECVLFSEYWKQHCPLTWFNDEDHKEKVVHMMFDDNLRHFRLNEQGHFVEFKDGKQIQVPSSAALPTPLSSPPAPPSPLTQTQSAKRKAREMLFPSLKRQKFNTEAILKYMARDTDNNQTL